MNTSEFQQDIGGLDAYMKRITKATKGYGQLSSNDTAFSDSWFRLVKTEEEENIDRVDCGGPVKKSTRDFN